jgi:hypothetical protein
VDGSAAAVAAYQYLLENEMLARGRDPERTN